ncbi:MAG: 30S ribosomal protein S7 [Candidatus Levybacteria bacterium RIFCSPHIGHO2_02_FULL_42_12]|nr:MAG: 30S ribosomal protein S7 [Candidatus Levybacteria bacterium RIFCSPHIGHO2_01_FULL_42_15]OGH30891.1 MAG: 30S ribosomal protein S7 [Candidatus Levybacteria bacterium RIFCSPHIGHO2_02_FULL_42_12]
MRHKKTQKRDTEPDKIYKSKLITKCINRMMRDGKKTVAERIFYEACDLIEKKSLDPFKTFEQAVQNIGPKVEVRPRRVGGASYQVPAEVRGDRKISLAIRWLISSARGKSNKEYHTFSEKLASEIMDAAENKGEAIKKRDTIHKTAEANKAFAHFRW